MTIQIAVRLPEVLVEFVDGEVAAGRAESRAQVVRRALARERRRQGAERDAEIYAAMNAAGEPHPFADLHAWSARQPKPELELD